MIFSSATLVTSVKPAALLFAFLFAVTLGFGHSHTLDAAPPSNGKNVSVWFGTTTPRGGLSKGIYHAKLNTDKGTLSTPTLAAEISSPGFLALHPKHDVLYSVGIQSGKPAVTAFRIDDRGGDPKLSMLNSVEIGDGGAAHVSVDRTGKVLLTAQYGGGSTALFDLADDGSIKSRKQLVKHEGGSRVVANRQNKPHAHWTGTSPDNRFAFVPDLGLDKVVIYKLNADAGTIESHGFGVCPPGGGPRHMKFSPDGKFVYVLNELALSITTFAYDSAAGTMSAIDTVQTLIESVKEKETFNSASEIRVHESGKFVYSANRGNDSISAFKVDAATGKLSIVETEPIRGGWPRNFNIDPTGKWIVVAGRDSHTATVFEINQETGELTFIRQTAMVPSPICVLFDLKN